MNNRPSKTRFNPRPRAGSLPKADPAIRDRLPARVVPPAPAWCMKPLKPLGGMVKR